MYVGILDSFRVIPVSKQNDPTNFLKKNHFLRARGEISVHSKTGAAIFDD